MWLNVPLTEVTKKDDFKWGSKAQEAFDNLKRHVTTRLILALPDFTKVFVIESDASGNGLRTILLQQGRPIAYFSKALDDRNLTKLGADGKISERGRLLVDSLILMFVKITAAKTMIDSKCQSFQSVLTKVKNFVTFGHIHVILH
jgi:hypothetical protein